MVIFGAGPGERPLADTKTDTQAKWDIQILKIYTAVTSHRKHV